MYNNNINIIGLIKYEKIFWLVIWHSNCLIRISFSTADIDLGEHDSRQCGRIVAIQCSPKEASLRK